MSTNNDINKSHQRQGEKSPKTLIEIKQAEILKQIFMTPQPYQLTFLLHYPILNPPEKQLHN